MLWVPDDTTLAMQTFATCTEGGESTVLDCRCLAVKLNDLKNTMIDRVFKYGGDDTDAIYEWQSKKSLMYDQAQKTCVNRQQVSSASYQQCRELNIIARADYDDYCSCYAITYADILARVGPNSGIEPHKLMAEAMTYCNRRQQKKITSSPVSDR